MTTPDSVAIVSGGLDSSTLLHHLVKHEGKTPAVLTFLYGQKHQREIECARQQVAALQLIHHLILDVAGMVAPLFVSSALVNTALAVPGVQEVLGDPQPITYVPNRNTIFLALAVAYAETLGVDAVYYGAQRHDIYGYWDTTPDFLEQTNALYALNRKNPITIHAPFVNKSKAELVRLGLQMKMDYGQTWSCYQGGEKACGQCPTCAERLQAFREVGQRDPLEYERA